MDQIFRRTCSETIYIKEFNKQWKIRAQEDIMILDQNITTKTQWKSGFQWKTD